MFFLPISTCLVGIGEKVCVLGSLCFGAIGGGAGVLPFKWTGSGGAAGVFIRGLHRVYDQ